MCVYVVSDIVGCIGVYPFTGLDYWTGIFLVFTYSKVIFLVLHILSLLLSPKMKGLYKLSVCY